MARRIARLRRPIKTPATQSKLAVSDRQNRSQTISSIGVPITDVVLILGRHAVATANNTADLLPGATVHLLTVQELSVQRQRLLGPNVVYQCCTTIAQRVAYLRERPQPQIIVERGNNTRQQKLACFIQLFPFVTAGGAYRVEALAPSDPTPAAPPTVERLLTTINEIVSGADDVDASLRVQELAASTTRVDFEATSAVVHKKNAHQFKVRDSRANSLLTSRFGDAWGQVLLSKPAMTWQPRAEFITHGSGPKIVDDGEMSVPERFLRRYHRPLCFPLQRLRYGEYWLPDTFRHPVNEVLSHRRLISPTRDMARLKTDDGVPIRTVEGPCFYFDTEYPAHFGHVLTEVVSRYWGWRAAQRIEPEVRPLVGLQRGKSEMAPFQRAIFRSFGIDLDTVEYLQAGEAVEVEELYAASPDFVMPQYIAPELAEVWDLIRRGCIDEQRSDSPPRLFVSRRPKPIRTCLNGTEVEEMFAGLGYHVVYPEDLDFSAQVGLFNRAQVIAGYGGSAMFTSMFAPDARNIVISGDGYHANNEYLIRAVLGGRIDHFWAESVTKQPPGSFTWAAYQSNFTFDTARFEKDIAELTAQAPVDS